MAMDKDNQMPASVAAQTTSTKKTMAAAVALAPVETSTNVVAIVARVTANQRKASAEYFLMTNLLTSA